MSRLSESVVVSPATPGSPPSRLATAAIPLVAVVFLTACSATESISKAAVKVRTEATATKADLAEAVETGDVGPLALPPIERASARQDAIIAQAAGIAVAVTKVRDVTPWWATLLTWLAIAVVAVLVLFYCGPLIRVGVLKLAAVVHLIPTATKRDAAADAAEIKAKKANGGLTEDRVRAIERKKATDPRYQAALDAELAKQGVPT